MSAAAEASAAAAPAPASNAPPQVRVVFMQGAFCSAAQIDRVLEKADSAAADGSGAAADCLFPRSEIVPVTVDLPEVRLEPVAEEGRMAAAWHYTQQAFFRIRYAGRVRPKPHSVRLGLANLGQQSDIEALRARGVGVEAPFIAFGISRGAMTTFSRWALTGSDDAAAAAAGEEKKEELPYGTRSFRGETRPAFVLLEGCPDSVPATLLFRHGAKVAGWVESLLERATSYSKAQARFLAPIALAARFPLDLPVAFVTSPLDTSVPAAGTHRLVEALRQRGHKHVHLLELQDAGHDGYWNGTERDRLAYKKFVQELRDRYLP